MKRKRKKRKTTQGWEKDDREKGKNGQTKRK